MLNEMFTHSFSLIHMYIQYYLLLTFTPPHLLVVLRRHYHRYHLPFFFPWKRQDVTFGVITSPGKFSRLTRRFLSRRTTTSFPIRQTFVDVSYDSVRTATAFRARILIAGASRLSFPRIWIFWGEYLRKVGYHYPSRDTVVCVLCWVIFYLSIQKDRFFKYKLRRNLLNVIIQFNRIKYASISRLVKLVFLDIVYRILQ